MISSTYRATDRVHGTSTFGDVPLGPALLNLSLLMFPPPWVLLSKGDWGQPCSQFFSSSTQASFLLPQGLEKHKGINLPNHPSTVLPWPWEEDREVTGWCLTSRECSQLGLQPHPPLLEAQIQMCVNQVSGRVLQLGRPWLCLYVKKISWAMAGFSPTGWSISRGFTVMDKPAQTEKSLSTD